MGSSRRRVEDSASKAFVLSLGLVSSVVLTVVLVLTRGRSHQLAVEGRMDELKVLATGEGLPLLPLVALCIREAHEGGGRSDAELARALGRSLRAADGKVRAAFSLLFTDPVEARLVLDLLDRNRRRWERLAKR